MGTVLNNVKNKHLLAVIAVLCASNVLACLALVFGEKRNAADLAALWQQQAQDRDEAKQELAKLVQHTNELNRQQAQALRSARKDIQAVLDGTRAELRSVQGYLSKLQSKRWLIGGKPEDMPWHKELRGLQKRLGEAEKKLERLPVPKEGEPKK